MSDYGPGDRVRVTFEGTIDPDGDLDLGVGRARIGGRWICNLDERDAVVEVIEKARPEWAERRGVVVLDTTGHAWQRTPLTWACTCRFGAHDRSYDELNRTLGPLALLHDPDPGATA